MGISLLGGFYFNKSDVTFNAVIRKTNGGHEGNIKESTSVICFLDNFSPKVSHVANLKGCVCVKM